MKPMLSIFIGMLIVCMSGCASGQKSPPQTGPSSSATQPLPEVSTAQGGGQAVGLPASTPGGGGDLSTLATLPVGGVTLADNGKTFTMQAGDSFLLNLGTDMYEWSDVQIDPPEVLQLKMGVLVIRGAQGIYVAQAPGTATLTTNGDPLCLKAAPPCKIPSILFRITVVVK